MSDLISRSALIEDLRMIDTECIFDDKEDILEKALATVDIQPTVEAKPVVHGEWIKYPSSLHRKCSVCKMEFPLQDVVGSKFCRNCGADMRKKVE